MYRNLLAEMVKRNISQKFLAKQLGICDKTLFNKLYGFTQFTWEEVKSIKKIVAPYSDIEELFEFYDCE